MKKVFNFFWKFLIVISILAAILCAFFMRGAGGNAKLEQLQGKISKLPVRNINNGGCGFMALSVTDFLDSADIEYTIVRIDGENDLVDDYSIPNHVLVKIKNENFYIDGFGFFRHPYLRIFGSKFTVINKEELRHLVHQPGWRQLFNKADTIIIQHQIVYDGIKY